MRARPGYLFISAEMHSRIMCRKRRRGRRTIQMLIKFLKPTRICKKIKVKSNTVGKIFCICRQKMKAPRFYSHSFIIYSFFRHYGSTQKEALKVDASNTIVITGDSENGTPTFDCVNFQPTRVNFHRKMSRQKAQLFQCDSQQMCK